MKITYREARSEDLHELLPLLKLLFSIEEDFSFSPHRQLLGLRLLLDSANSTIIVADSGTGPIGMVTGQLVISTAEGAPSLLVEDLVIQKEYQGKGVGSTLLNTVATWGNKLGASRMQLLADTTNTKALNFYTKVGWSRTQLICLRHYPYDPQP